MNQRIQKFLGAENISQSQFADTIGVARASISHILSGRNKPGFDFIEKMSHSYPNLNLEWLITGKGKMYKTGYLPAEYEEDVAQPSLQSQERDLFSVDSEENGDAYSDLFSASNKEQSPAAQKPVVSDVLDDERDSLHETAQKAVKQAVKAKEAQLKTGTPQDKYITKVIVFYSDSTFQEIK